MPPKINNARRKKTIAKLAKRKSTESCAQCATCGKFGNIKNMLKPGKCTGNLPYSNENTKNPNAGHHRMCQDCWFGKEGQVKAFAGHDVGTGSHKCPGCIKNAPLAVKALPKNHVFELDDD